MLNCRTGLPLYAPQTQEPLVMTADAFEEQKELFARMGELSSLPLL